MLRSISLRKEFSKAKADEVIFFSSPSQNQPNVQNNSAQSSIDGSDIQQITRTSGKYKYIIAIFYQQADSLRYLITQLFSQDLGAQITSSEKCVYAYASDLEVFANILFIFSESQFTDEDFGYTEKFMIDSSDLIIGLDYTTQDSYHSCEQYLKRSMKDRDNPLAKKHIHYLYASEQDITDLPQATSSKDSISRFYDIQNETSIREIIFPKLAGLQSHEIVPLPATKILPFFTTVWDNLIPQHPKSTHLQLKQIICGCHFEEEWDRLKFIMEKRSLEYRRLCLAGDIHDFKKQQKEFADVAAAWRTSTIFLEAALPLIMQTTPIEQDTIAEIQTQTFRIFHFQLSNIRGSLKSIFYQKLALLQEEQNNQPLTSAFTTRETLIRQSSQPSQQLSAANPHIPASMTSSIVLTQSTVIPGGATTNSTTVPSNNPEKSVASAGEQLPANGESIPERRPEEEEDELIDSSMQLIMKRTDSLTANETIDNDLLNETAPLIKRVDSLNGNTTTTTTTTTSNNAPNPAGTNANPPVRQYSLLTASRVSLTGGASTTSKIEMSTKIPSRLSTPSARSKTIVVSSSSSSSHNNISSNNNNSNSTSNLNNLGSIAGGNSHANPLNSNNINLMHTSITGSAVQAASSTLRRVNSLTQKLTSSTTTIMGQSGISTAQFHGINSTSSQAAGGVSPANSNAASAPEEMKLYDIMKKAKLRVLSELKSKMVTMLDATVKQELGIEAEMESIEEEINEIIIKELKQKAEIEVNELVQQRILAILRNDLSKLFDEKDLDFWLKFKALQNKIMAEWIPKIERFLKERYNFSQRHSGELLRSAQEIIHKDTRNLIKVKIGEIMAQFLQDLEKNLSSSIQGREDSSKIYERYKEFLLELRSGQSIDETPRTSGVTPSAAAAAAATSHTNLHLESTNQILTNEQFELLLVELQQMLQAQSNKFKLKYHTAKLSIEKYVMHRRNTFFSLNPYFKLNAITISMAVVFAVLLAKDSIAMENSIAILLFTHILTTFVRS